MRFQAPSPRPPAFAKATAGKQAVVAAAVFSAAITAACVTPVQPVDMAPVAPPALSLPRQQDSIRFAVIGDTGTGGAEQYRLAQQMIAAHSQFPFEFVLMTGDNMYGPEGPRDFIDKFERPYKPLLDTGVKFYAALGNHDETDQIFYKPFNMDGKRFYSVKPKPDLRFYAVDSTYLSPEQMAWLEKELADSTSKWKVVFFHHPPYSTGGRHGSDVTVRAALEPLFTRHGVDVVFTGHDHFYERIKPQQGIHYFVSGGGGKLRRGDVAGGEISAKAFDEGYHFMLIEVVGDVMHFQVINEVGKTVDNGAINRPDVATAPEGSN
ncbi:MAG: metallophosphoesterase [Vicinamibacterales bacterium]